LRRVPRESGNPPQARRQRHGFFAAAPWCMEPRFRPIPIGGIFQCIILAPNTWRRETAACGCMPLRRRSKWLRSCSVRIPANADSDSDRLRTAIPIDRGQRSGDRGQWLPSTALRAHSAVSVSSFPRLGAFSGGLRRVSPSRARRCAVWTRRSRTASAIVGSTITSCQ
jgi:hypothetical protein